MEQTNGNSFSTLSQKHPNKVGWECFTQDKARPGTFGGIAQCQLSLTANSRGLNRLSDEIGSIPCRYHLILPLRVRVEVVQDCVCL
jgi:hypothetical protein